MDVSEPLDRYNVYMPGGPESPFPVCLPPTGDVDRLGLEIRRSVDFRKYLDDMVPVNMFKVGL